MHPSTFLPASLLVMTLPLAAMNVNADAVLAPHQLKVQRGSVSDQGVEVLAESSQRGASDDWRDYLEIHPDSSGFRGLLYYTLDVESAASKLESMTLAMNWRGPTRTYQRWRIRAKNKRTGRWSDVPDYTALRSWRWRQERVQLPGDPSDRVDALGRIRLHLSTPPSADNLNVDSMKLDVELDNPGPASPRPDESEIWQPSPGTSWQWQLQGAIDTGVDVDMYDIDLFDTPQATIDELHADGRVVICYFSAGSSENWRPDHAAFPASVQGRSNGWSGERWLDIRALDVLGPLMAARLDLAVSKGCDGVEPDNVDGYSNETGFALLGSDQIRFNRWLADAAHVRGLSIGLKNDVEQAAELVPYFDWALNEQCVYFNECEALLPFTNAGKAVFGVEYTGDPERFCSLTNALDFDWLDKDQSLGVRREACR